MAAALLKDAKLLRPGKDAADAVAPEAAFSGKQYVAFYFSAHWCGPCQRFTPRFAEVYKQMPADKLEVVFVSADRDAKTFNAYRATMPWLAVDPFEDEEATQALQEHFGIEGFPTVAIVDVASGKTLTTDAVGDIAADPTGAGCPWAPRSLREILADDVPIIAGKANEGATCLGDLRKRGVQHAALYFSAHWCPPCRQFTPKLAALYSEMVAASPSSKPFEFIFLSSDRSESDFKEYHAEMGFAAVPLGHEAIGALSKTLQVQGIPTLVTVDLTTGEVVNAKARGEAEKPGAAGTFPWPPRPLPDVLIFEPCDEVFDQFAKRVVVVDCSSLSKEAAAEVHEVVTSAVKELKATGSLNTSKTLVTLCEPRTPAPRAKEHCLEGCTLTAVPESRAAGCDACGKDARVGGHTCEQHNFDLCDKCFEAEVVVPSPGRKLLLRVLDFCKEESRAGATVYAFEGLRSGDPAQKAAEGFSGHADVVSALRKAL